MERPINEEISRIKEMMKVVPDVDNKKIDRFDVIDYLGKIYNESFDGNEEEFRGWVERKIIDFVIDNYKDRV